MTFTAPIGGTNVISEGEGPPRNPQEPTPPATHRKSLHTVRMAAPSAPEYEPQWTDKMQLKWVQKQQSVEPIAEPEQVVDSPIPRGNGLPDNGAQTQPYDALRQEMAELKQTMQLMAQGMGEQPQQPQGPTPPDPAEFDFYDPHQVKEFHRLNNEYIQATVQQSLHSALVPHEDARRYAEYTRQYNSVVAEHGRLADGSENLNFQPLMEKAIQLVVSSGEKFSIPEAYKFVLSSQITSPHQAASSPGARTAQRTLTAQEAAQKATQARSLPTRNGVSGAGEQPLPAALQNINSLGRIMFHNQQSGRARPI